MSSQPFSANSDKQNITKHCDKLVTIDKEDSLCHNKNQNGLTGYFLKPILTNLF